MDDLFYMLAPKYQAGQMENDLDLVFNAAAMSGIILLPGEGHPYTKAKCDSYDIADLLLPANMEAWGTITNARAAGMEIYPDWFTLNESGYLDFSQETFVKTFIERHRISKHHGEYQMDGAPVKYNAVRNALRRSLAIVRADAGSLIKGAYATLTTLVDDDEPEEKKGRLTRETLVDEMHKRGFSAKLNVISAEYEISGTTETGRALSQDDLMTIMHDELGDEYKGISFDVISQYIAYAARENSYNPVLDLLSGTKWDGVDRLPQLYAVIGIDEDKLSQTLVRKWLMQTVALLFNDAADPFGADGCLVFNGEQGAGKTSLLRHLAMKDTWFAEGCSVDDHDKDTTRRIVTRWVSELGEVESTLKSDISKLKAFVSAAVDRYRLPYGRSDIVTPRHTSLAATCNSDRYLIDPTGNRRWWSVPFTRKIPREELLELDALQLWAQIFALVSPLSYADKTACFRLTAEEQTQLAKRNGDYEKPIKGQVEVEDILAQAEEEGLTFRRMTVSEFTEEWTVLRKYTAQQIGTALKACGIESIRTKTARLMELPTRLKAGNPF